MTTETTSDTPTGDSGGTEPSSAPTGTGAGYENYQHAYPLYRAREGHILGGVAAGVPRYFDLDVSVVRIAFVVLALLGGAGIPLYLAGWLLIPEEGTGRTVLADLLHTLRRSDPRDLQRAGTD